MDMISLFGNDISVVAVYWGLLLFGLILAAVSWLLEGLFDFMDDGAIMPAVGVFILLFGGTGLSAIYLFDASVKMSAFSALGLSTIGAALFYTFFMKMLLAQDNTLSDARGDLVGLEAEVTLPSDGESLGQITYVTASGRSSWPARTANGKPLKQGDLVKIVRCTGSTCIVEEVVLGIK